MFQNTLSRVSIMKPVPKLSTLANANDFMTIYQHYAADVLKPSSKQTHFPPSTTINNKVGFMKADITNLKVDAIVNAANETLYGGGGVDGAIHKAAGRGLLKECIKLNGCRTGEAKITAAYNLPCEKVIHTVGPIYNMHSQEQSKALLESCYQKSLDVATQNDCRSVVFSCVSTGVYGFPHRAAARVACEMTRKFLEGPDGDKLDKVLFCIFMDVDAEAYQSVAPEYFPPATENSETTQGKAET